MTETKSSSVTGAAATDNAASTPAASAAQDAAQTEPRPSFMSRIESEIAKIAHEFALPVEDVLAAVRRHL